MRPLHKQFRISSFLLLLAATILLTAAPEGASAQETRQPPPGRILRLGPGQQPGTRLPTVFDATPLLEEAFRRLAAMSPDMGRAAAPLAPTGEDEYVVGDRKNFWTVDFSKGVSFPYTQYEVEAECRAVGEYAYFFVEVEQLDVVSGSALADFVTAFEDSTSTSPRDPSKGIYKHVTEVFGDVPDVDGDPKIVILLTEIASAAQGAGGTAFWAGYFNPTNQYADPVDFGGGVEQRSNHTEMLYVNSLMIGFEDPNDEVRTRLIRNLVKGAIAHEFQHLIQFDNDPDEITAVNEGLSEYASYICGYGLRRLAPYVVRTNVNLFSWRDYGISVEEDYARMSLWTYYLGTRFGDAYIKELSENPQGGAAGVEASLAALGHGSLESAYSDFITALYLGGGPWGDAAFDMDPVTTWVEPKSHENLYPSVERVYLEPYGAVALRYWNCTQLDLSFLDGLPAGVSARLALKGAGGFDVSDLTAAGGTFTGLGTTWDEAAVILTNGGGSPAGTFRLSADGNQGSEGMVRYEKGDPQLVVSMSSIYHAGVRFTPEVAPAKLTGLWLYYRKGSSADLAARTMQENAGTPGTWIVDESPFWSDVITPGFSEEGWIYVPIPDPGFSSQEGVDYLISMRLSDNYLGYTDLSQKMLRSFLRLSSAASWQPLSNFVFHLPEGDFVLNGNWMIRAEFSYTDDTAPTISLGLLQHPLFPAQVEVYVTGNEPLHHGLSSGTLTPSGGSAVDLVFERTLGAFAIVDPTPILLQAGQVNLSVEGHDRYGGFSDTEELSVTVTQLAAGEAASLISASSFGAVTLDIPPGSHGGTTLLLTPYYETPSGIAGAPPAGNSDLGAPVISLGPTGWAGPSAGSVLSIPVHEHPEQGEEYRFERWNGSEWEAVPGGVTVARGFATGLIPGGGWYRLAMGRAPEAADVDTGVELLGNAPNPFNPQTVISFRIPSSEAGENVKLTILNVRGQVVKTLVDGSPGVGLHSVTWYGDDRSGRKVASGIYLYRLEVGGKVLTRKMLLLR